MVLLGKNCAMWPISIYQAHGQPKASSAIAGSFVQGRINFSVQKSVTGSHALISQRYLPGQSKRIDGS